MFDGIPSSMCDVLESESITMASGLQPWSTVDEKDGIVD
jgi:hypothetical protein